jgi:2-keto-4-pentenoate hydratase/2-oxohepta-3-ene-1,7-dioic acid hydratase in catechol pathway
MSMKIVSFSVMSRPSFGLLTDTGVIDVGSRLGRRHDGLHDLLAREGGEGTIALVTSFANADVDYPTGAFVLDKPLTTWGKCFCVGVNYPDRNSEYKDGSDQPRYPSLFIRFPSSFTGPGQPLLRPPESEQLDYEGEIVLVVGKAGRRIQAAHWAEHVFGWTLANEGTIRDWVRHGKFNVTPGKNWPQTGAIGPWIVPFAEAGAGPFEITTRVNGEIRQQDSTDRMMFPFGRIVEYVSSFCELLPGDVILTGTPTGAGARFDPPVWLKPGDVIEIEVPGIGLLRNGVRDETECDNR